MFGWPVRRAAVVPTWSSPTSVPCQAVWRTTGCLWPDALSRVYTMCVCVSVYHSCLCDMCV